jgi:NADPH-dependent ferric siderophore reductase
MAPPHRPPPRDLNIIRTERITPNMQRVTLGGPGLAGFPDAQGGYVKLQLSDAAGGRAIRTYTVRAQRASEIDVDFALHAETATGHAGPATEWALTVQPGEHIAVGGPGPAKPLPPGHDFYLIAGDMTALPAIAVNLAALPEGARGAAVIEVMSEADRQALARPDGVDIIWLVNPQPGSDPAALATAVRAIPADPATLYAWAACEFSAMQGLRTYLRGELGLGPDRLYISSYWKSGLTEEAHKVAKREDAEAQG